MSRLESAPAFAVPFLEKEPALLNPMQMGVFTYENIHAHPVEDYNPHEALARLARCQGKSVVTVDLGGKKLSAQVATLRGTGLVLQEVFGPPLKSEDEGAGYHQYLERVSEYALRNGLPVGVSTAGVLEGTLLKASPNAGTFIKELHAKHGGDFAQLFPTLRAFDNDAVAGLISGSMEAVRQDSQTNEFVYIINGGGANGAVIIGNKAYGMELAHVPVIDTFNTNPRQQKPCGLFSDAFVCVERVAASGAGIEDLYFQETGEQLTGPEIEARYHAGDELAGRLYETSAILTGHMVQAIANIFKLDLARPSAVVIAHGGCFKFDAYGRRVDQVVARSLQAEPRFLVTHDYTPNACADGAAKKALIATYA